MIRLKLDEISRNVSEGAHAVLRLAISSPELALKHGLRKLRRDRRRHLRRLERQLSGRDQFLLRGELEDPATAPLPTGCGFIWGAQTYVSCLKVKDLNISGYDFGHSVAGSVQLYIAGGVTGTLTISNDKFFGPSVDSQYFAVVIYPTNSVEVY
jgi:hypothetical protein